MFNFNRKLRLENKQLISDNHDLGKELEETKEELRLAIVEKWGLGFQVKNLESVISAQGALVDAFAEYICSNIPKPKRKYVRKVNIEKPKSKRPGRPKLKHRGRPRGKKNVK